MRPPPLGGLRGVTVGGSKESFVCRNLDFFFFTPVLAFLAFGFDLDFLIVLLLVVFGTFLFLFLGAFGLEATIIATVSRSTELGSR